MQKITIEFILATHVGIVEVSCEVNNNPDLWGFQYFTPNNMILDNIKGFPICSAEVSYNLDGYGRFMGWVQVIHMSKENERLSFVDIAPQFLETKSPFFCWGLTPDFFDAPYSLTEESEPTPNTEWIAYAFLTSSPDKVISKKIKPICGFKWGYRIDEQKRVTILNLEEINEKDWGEKAQEIIAKNYPDWDVQP